MQERQITTRLHALCLGVGEEAARQILERDLQKRKICYRFVAHSVTVDGGEHRVECCSNLIDFADQDRDELQRIVSGCESWCFQFNPEKKRQLNEFSSAEEHQVANVACQENADFFYATGTIQRKFVPGGTTVNNQYYLVLIERLYSRMGHVRNEKFETAVGCCCMTKRTLPAR